MEGFGVATPVPIYVSADYFLGLCSVFSLSPIALYIGGTPHADANSLNVKESPARAGLVVVKMMVTELRHIMQRRATVRISP